MTSPSELVQAVRRSVALLRSVGAPPAVTMAWVTLWRLRYLQPDKVPACLSFDRLAEPGPFTDVQVLQLMALDSRFGGLGVIGQLVASRHPGVRCRLAALWGGLDDYDGDAISDAYMVLLHG